MKGNQIFLAVLIIMQLVVTPCFSAKGDDAVSKKSEIPILILGKKLALRMHVYGFQLKDDFVEKKSVAQKIVIVEKRVTALENNTKYTPAEGKKTLTVYSAGAGSSLYNLGEIKKNKTSYYNILFRNDEDIISAPAKSNITSVESKREYLIEASKLSPASCYTKYAFVGGPLLVPFKWRESGLTSDPAIGAYIGIRNDSLFFEKTAFVSAGLSNVAVESSSDDSSTDNSENALTLAIGVMLRSTENFQFAFIIGQDRIGGTAGDSWEHEGETWFSLAVGVDLFSK